jgi:hypothetical protein
VARALRSETRLQSIGYACSRAQTAKQHITSFTGRGGGVWRRGSARRAMWRGRDTKRERDRQAMDQRQAECPYVPPKNNNQDKQLEYARSQWLWERLHPLQPAAQNSVSTGSHIPAPCSEGQFLGEAMREGVKRPFSRRRLSPQKTTTISRAIPQFRASTETRPWTSP